MKKSCRTRNTIDNQQLDALLFTHQLTTGKKGKAMIKREYKTKEECVGLFMDDDFDAFPSWVVTDADSDWYEHWTFRGELDEYEADKQEEDYGYVDIPMWSTWFIPRGFVYDWIERNEEAVMDCGFTLIYHDDDLLAIGVDGAGYSFRDTHFARLYDAMGMRWHDED